MARGVCATALGFFLIGCGGSAVLQGPPHSLVLVGGPDSPVLSELKKRMPSSASVPSSFTSEHVIVVDGDTASPESLGQGSITDRALKAGAAVLLIDAREEHKKALCRKGAALGFLNGKSHAVLMTLTSAGNHRCMKMLHLSAEDRQRKRVKSIGVHGVLTTGIATEDTIPRLLTPSSTRNFADRAEALLGSSWIDPVAAQVPATIPFYSVEVLQAESASADAALSGQTIQESLTYIYRVLYDPIIPCQRTYIQVDGAMDTGALAGNGSSYSDNLFNFYWGWYQTEAHVKVGPPETQDGGWIQSNGDLTSCVGNTYTPGNGLTVYTGTPDNPGFWGITYAGAGPTIIDQWTMSSDATQNASKTTYYQTSPYNFFTPDLNSMISQNGSGDPQIAPMPALGSGSIPIHARPNFYIGITPNRYGAEPFVEFPYDAGRTFHQVQVGMAMTQYGYFLASAGLDAISDEGANSITLDFSQALPD